MENRRFALVSVLLWLSAHHVSADPLDLVVGVKMIDIPACVALRTLATTFNAANPGIFINVTCSVSSVLLWHSDFATDLDRSTPQWDLHVIDGLWMGEAEGRLLDLTDWIHGNLQYGDFYEQLMKAYSEYPPNSKRYLGLPFLPDVFAIAYSKSAFARHNKSLPSNVEELVDLAEYFKAQSTDFSGGISHTYWCGNYSTCPSRANRFMASTLIRSYGGSTWDSATYKLDGVFDSDRNIEALSLMKRLWDASYQDVNTIFPNEFCAGRLPMVVSFASLMPMYTSCGSDIGLYPFPYSDKYNTDGLFLGGMGIVLLKNSPVQAAALEFLKFAMTRAAQRIMARGGAFTVRKSVAADPSFVIDSNNTILTQNVIFLQSIARGFPDVNLPIASQLSDIEEQYLSKMLLNQLPVETAVRSIARDQQALMDVHYPCGPKCPIPFKRNEALFTALFAFSIIVLAAFGALAAAVYKLRDTPMLRASALPFLSFTILGAVLMIISFTLEYQEDPSDSRCLSIPWIRLLGMAILFGALVVKTYRIAAIFSTKKITPLGMTTTYMMRYFAALVSIFVIFLIIWTAVDPARSTVKMDESGSDTISYRTCDQGRFSTYSTLLEMLLLLCASVLAVQVRNAPSGFHEARYIGIGIYNWAVVTGVCFLITHSVSDHNVVYAFDGILVLLTAPVIMGLLFVPKFYGILRGLEPSTHSNDSPQNGVGGSGGNSGGLTPRSAALYAAKSARQSTSGPPPVAPRIDSHGAKSQVASARGHRPSMETERPSSQTDLQPSGSDVQLVQVSLESPHRVE